MLIIAATPIGNLGDASPRLLDALQETEFIAAEDTRNLLHLVHGLCIRHNAKLFSLHEHNESKRLGQLVQLARDGDLLLVSDAGMPTVSDPGYQLVRACAAAGVQITVIPGPSAVLAALAVSGLPTDRFCFEGFLPRSRGERRAKFAELSTERRTMVFFESPHRILESLKDAAQEIAGDRPAAVCRELTKKFEHTERGTLAELVDWVAASAPKGEMVLVIAGAVAESVAASDLVPAVLALTAQGVGLKQAVAEVAEARSVSKSQLYALALAARTS